MEPAEGVVEVGQGLIFVSCEPNFTLVAALRTDNTVNYFRPGGCMIPTSPDADNGPSRSIICTASSA